MTTFLILSPDKFQRETYAKDFCHGKNISDFDISILDIQENKSSLGIEDIRSMQKRIILMPLKSQEKAIIIHDGQTLTTEAQNALLKTLEEPPDHTYILVTGDREETFLPTIRSRSKILFLEADTHIQKVSPEEIDILYSERIGDKLYLAQLYGENKDKALAWLTAVTVTMRKELLAKIDTSETHHLLDIATSLQEAIKTLKTTNTNPRMTLEHMLMKLVASSK